MGDISELTEQGVLCSMCGILIEPIEITNMPRICKDCEDSIVDKLPEIIL